MRALWLGLLLVLVLGVTLGPAVFAPKPAAQDQLVILSPHWDGIRTEFETAFQAHWREKTGREVEFVWLDVGGGASEIKRYIVERGRKTDWAHGQGIGVDLLFGGGVFDFRNLMSAERLKKDNVDAPDGLLEPFMPPPEFLADIPEEVNGQPLRDKQGRWHATCLSGFGIVYNRLVVERAHLPVPEQWADLARPEYYGWVSCGDPTRSGSVQMAFEIMLQAYSVAGQDAAERAWKAKAGEPPAGKEGAEQRKKVREEGRKKGWEQGWSVLVRLAANVAAFNEGGGSVPRDVSLGQSAAGPCIDFYAAAPVRRQGATHLEFVFPKGLSVVTPDALALLRNAPHAEVAREFIQFTLSVAGQRLWYQKRGTAGGPVEFDLERLPVRKSLYAEDLPTYTVARPFEQGQAFAYDDARAGVRWDMIKHVWRAAILDVHPDLRAAWAAVLRAGRVSDLGPALGRPPLTEEQLARVSKEKLAPVQVNALRAGWTGWAREYFRAIRAAAETGAPAPEFRGAGDVPGTPGGEAPKP